MVLIPIEDKPSVHQDYIPEGYHSDQHILLTGSAEPQRTMWDQQVLAVKHRWY